MEYTNEYIKELFESSKNQTDVLRKIGRKRNGAGDRIIRKLAKQINFDLTKYGNNTNHISREEYDDAPKYCRCCGKKLSYKQRGNKFCSRSCSARIKNMGRTHSLDVIKEGKEKEINKNCLNCGKELSKRQKNNKFCCHHCSTEYRYNELIKRWLDGENFVKGGHQIPTFIKRYLMELHDNKCEKCGWGEEHPITHTIPLEVHHIDGDCTNNNIKNLQLLCPNCHCLTENFGSLNKNSKRFHRGKIKVL